MRKRTSPISLAYRDGKATPPRHWLKGPYNAPNAQERERRRRQIEQGVLRPSDKAPGGGRRR